MRIGFNEAMDRYGSDKPDLRIDLEVQDMTALVEGSEFALAVRIPGWCRNWTASIGGVQIDPAESGMDRGYLCIDRKWKGETVIRLSFDMPVEVVSADPRVKADEGKRALMRGPLVYCMEGIDNVGTYQSARLDSTTTFTTEYDASLLCGVQTISAETPEGTLRFVPYYSWDNREACPMKVWVDYGTLED